MHLLVLGQELILKVLSEGLNPCPNRKSSIVFNFFEIPKKVLDKDSSTCYNKIDERRIRFCILFYDPLLKVFLIKIINL